MSEATPLKDAITLVEAPDKVTLNSQIRGNTAVALNWSPQTQKASSVKYLIEVREGNNPFTELGQTDGVTRYTAADLNPGQTYTFKFSKLDFINEIS